MLLGGNNFSRHKPWIIGVVLAALLAIAWFGVAAWRASRLPGGSSLPGFTFGVAGGLIILFEFLLWPRKWVRTWRIGQTKTWMTAHIWLGLLTAPLLILHSGFVLGGSLATVLMVLLIVVVASGVWGLILQQLLPQRMLNELPAETIYSQIDGVMQQFTLEAERLVTATCGYPADESVGPEEELAAAGTRYLTLGAVRSAGKIQGKVVQTRVPATPVAGAEPLRAYFQHLVLPYLEGKAGPRSPLFTPHQARTAFDDMRTKLAPEAHPALGALEDLCNQRRQLEKQKRLHAWLHSWLLLHLPLSVALVVLMFVHIVKATKFW